MGVGELLPRLSTLALAGGLFLLHFPGGYPRLTLSAILPCGARTFLTAAPFGILLRGRSTKRRGHYITPWLCCQIECAKSRSFNVLEIVRIVFLGCVILREFRIADQFVDDGDPE